MRKLGLLLPLLTGFAAAPAYAQDLAVSARGEVRVGYDEVRADLTVQNSIFSDDFGVSDVMFGAEAGVDARITRGLLIGAYAGIDVSEVDDCKANPFSRRSDSRRDNVCLEAGNNLYAGGRLGFAMNETGLIYVKGGYSRAKFSGSYSVTQAGAGQRVGEIFSGRDTVGGYHFGGGFELDVSPSVYIKGEYVQHRYKDAFTDLLNTTTSTNPLSQTDRFDPKRQQLVFGIGFRFGGR